MPMKMISGGILEESVFEDAVFDSGKRGECFLLSVISATFFQSIHIFQDAVQMARNSSGSSSLKP